MSTFHATKSALRVIQLFPCLSVWFREKLVQVINEVYSMIVSGTWDSHCDYPGGKIDACFWGIHTTIQSPSAFIKWNNEFITQVENSKQDIFGNMRFATEQEILTNELEKLEKLLANYLDAENSFIVASKALIKFNSVTPVNKFML